jgi:hypothetical protein
MELIIEENPPINNEGPNPFKDFKLPTFARRQPQQQQLPTRPPIQSQYNPPLPTNKYHPREPFKQPSYHQKYQQVEKRQSQANPIQPQPQQQPKSNPTFSYDDILNSLHMKVNNGKLEYNSPIKSLEKTKNKIINHYFQSKQQQQQQQHQQQQHQHQQQQQHQHQQQYQQQQPQYKRNENNETFNQPESNKQPMTREEYQKRMAYYLWKKQEERKRIAQIKSKKMLYPTENIQISRTKFTSLPFG